MWRRSYVSGKDFTEGMKLTVSAFPGQTFMGWQWPNVKCPVGVYDFSAIDYGNYYGTNVPVPIPPKQVSNSPLEGESQSA